MTGNILREMGAVGALFWMVGLPIVVAVLLLVNRKKKSVIPDDPADRDPRQRFIDDEDLYNGPDGPFGQSVQP